MSLKTFLLVGLVGMCLAAKIDNKNADSEKAEENEELSRVVRQLSKSIDSDSLANSGNSEWSRARRQLVNGVNGAFGGAASGGTSTFGGGLSSGAGTFVPGPAGLGLGSGFYGLGMGGGVIGSGGGSSGPARVVIVPDLTPIQSAALNFIPIQQSGEPANFFSQQGRPVVANVIPIQLAGPGSVGFSSSQLAAGQTASRPAAGQSSGSLQSNALPNQLVGQAGPRFVLVPTAGLGQASVSTGQQGGQVAQNFAPVQPAGRVNNFFSQQGAPAIGIRPPRPADNVFNQQGAPAMGIQPAAPANNLFGQQGAPAMDIQPAAPANNVFGQQGAPAMGIQPAAPANNFIGQRNGPAISSQSTGPVNDFFGQQSRPAIPNQSAGPVNDVSRQQSRPAIPSQSAGPVNGLSGQQDGSSIFGQPAQPLFNSPVQQTASAFNNQPSRGAAPFLGFPRYPAPGSFLPQPNFINQVNGGGMGPNQAPAYPSFPINTGSASWESKSPKTALRMLLSSLRPRILLKLSNILASLGRRQFSM